MSSLRTIEATPARSAARLGFGSPKRSIILSSLLLVVVFVLFRWAQRLEPLNSDDMILFELSSGAAQGRHWLFGAPLEPGDATLANPPHALHTAFRIGLLPLSAPMIALLGENAAAYYLTPLLFAFAGFAALCWVLLRCFEPRVALVFAALHVIWPFELEHASLFLTDLPAAATSLISICLLVASADREGRQRIGFALLAGLAAFETYLLRNNGLVLLAPAYLLTLLSRSTRAQTLWALGVTAAGVLAQQAFLAHRGLGWGYDWLIIRKDFAEYRSFLPIHSWGGFLIRQFTYQLHTFGRGLTGLLAVLLVFGSLLAHLFLLLREKHTLLRSLAAFGLFSWLVFSFSIYELTPEGVRATVPVNYRFVQPFTYSSLIVWAWVTSRARSALSVREAAAATRPRLPPSLAYALPLLLVTFSLMAVVERWPQTYARSETRQLLRALSERASDAGEGLLVAGTKASLRVARLLGAGELPPGVTWRELPPAELGDLIDRKAAQMVLRDVGRELTLARYLEPEARRLYRDALARVELALWRDHTLAHIDRMYALFVASSPSLPREPSPTAPAAPPAGPSAARPSPGTPACRGAAEASDGWRTLIPGDANGRLTRCELSWAEDGLTLPATQRSSLADNAGFVLRLQADYELPLSLSVTVVEHSGGSVRSQKVPVWPGASYVPVRLDAGAAQFSIVYTVSARDAPDHRVVRVRPAEWRPHRFTPL